MAKRAARVILLGSAVVAMLSGARVDAAGDGADIAGLRPDQRPAAAPVISTVQKNPGWYEKALQGVTAPFPASLRFLEDQGNWYSPFLHPGMTGPYDLRGWHAGDAAGSP